jgi:formylglycine-generating enzyme
MESTNRSSLARIAALLALAACDAGTASEAPLSASAAPPEPAPKPETTAEDAAGCPERMVRVEAFCIDRYEAQLVRVSDRSAHSPYERPKRGERYAAVSRAGVAPQGYVNRIEASAACEAAGKRLCRAREWYRACSGPKGLRYPYGQDAIAGRCNTDKGHVLRILFGEVKHSYVSHYNNPKVNQEPGFLGKTGEHGGCGSAEGVFDLVGNLHEWVADGVSARIRKEIPLENGDQWLGKRGMGIFMGGYFSSHEEHGKGCLYATMTHAPDYHDYSTGFRCCAEPDQRRDPKRR